MRVLGVDPGTIKMGVGVGDSEGGSFNLFRYAVLTPHRRDSLPVRLLHMFTELCRIIEESAPAEVAIEQPFAAKNIRYLRRVFDQMPTLVRQFHTNKHVSGEELPFCIDLGTMTHFDDFLDGNHHLINKVIHTSLVSLFLDRLRDLLLEARVDVNDIPTMPHRH